jgi:hypothetical protein
MSESDERYRQLALFTQILAEVVVTPAVLAGGAFWWFRDRPYRNLVVFIAAVAGLVAGFYRVALIQKRMRKRSEKDESGEK